MLEPSSEKLWEKEGLWEGVVDVLKDVVFFFSSNCLFVLPLWIDVVSQPL